ncbi:MAG TPA: thioredoxin family protein [Pyrinomonadaceae bacterium]|nr:thioredoxin family protein [Acidobacteriota bacterium]HQZ97535.1 thioredoxin family protein [Pyrinomonadaceae bacterium]
MKSNRSILSLLFVAVFTLVSASALFAQEPMKHDDMKKHDGMKKDSMMKDDAMIMDDKRPVVAIIAADWCPYCKRIDPVVNEVKSSYSEKLNFVVFDVTNAETTALAKAKAEKLGMSDFFNEYKGKTSTVAVLKDHKVVFKTSNNDKKSDYEKAFDEVLN